MPELKARDRDIKGDWFPSWCFQCGADFDPMEWRSGYGASGELRWSCGRCGGMHYEPEKEKKPEANQ